MEVTQNLWVALEQLRDLLLWNGCEWFWIDALCFNQKDKVEKSIQVQNMRSIYKHAGSVIAWLGSAEEQSDTVVSFLNLISIGAVEQSINFLEISSKYRWGDGKLPAQVRSHAKSS